MKKILLFAAMALLLASCGPTNPKYTRAGQYPKMYEEHPVVLLVMPPMNQSSDVRAKEYFYTSIGRPLAEAGYYVISPFLSMDILKAESAYDSELFVDRPQTFRAYFGADAVVYSEIQTWTKRGFGIATKVRYFIKSTTTGETLFDRTCDLYLDLDTKMSSSSSSLLVQLIDVAASAINTAATEHIVAARKANYYIFDDLPYGKYHPEYQKDGGYAASERDVQTTVR